MLSQITDIDKMYAGMKEKLSHIVPDVELRLKAELAVEINKLKKERNAVILGHNYMEAALFNSIPDFVGDSLELSRKAAQTDKDVIVFCGVKFMGETAKILNPSKKVLLPSNKAGCSLAESITAEDVRALKAQFPGVPVVTYVNTYADVKAESDICCTSGNAKKVVESINSDKIIFLPDEYLAGNIARETGKTIIFPTPLVSPHFRNSDSGTSENEARKWGDAESRGVMIGWNGRCEVHDQFTVKDVETVRAQFPDVLVLAHPECSPEVTAAADYSNSTTAMIRYVQETNAPHYLILTECSMGDNIAAANPDKEMLRLCMVRCPHMNTITMEDTLEALKQDRYIIEVPEDIRLRAEKAVKRMIEIG